MDDNTTELPLAPKQPYVRPQLHELAGSDGAGKIATYPFEVHASYGLS
jgi:hypothetical protein